MRQAERKSFTLIEMLVALTLISVIATGLAYSLRAGFNARRSAEAALEPMRAVAIALHLFERDIAATLPPRGILAGFFIGTDELSSTEEPKSDVVSFYAAIEEAGRVEPRIVKIRYALSDGGGGKGVLVRRVTHNLLAPVAEEPPDEIICRNVLAFNIRYFDGELWQDTWDSSAVGDVLPIAVEVQIAIPRRADSGADDDYYAMTRVFTLPCGTVPFSQSASSLALSSSTWR